MRFNFPIMKITMAWGLVVSFSMAQQVPRAVPVDETPNPVPRAVPVESGDLQIRRVTPADPNRPKGPDEDLYDYAILAYTQKDYEIALKPFSDYVRLYPLGRHAAESWFRLGECYLWTNHFEDAERCYAQLLKTFPRSESAASGAYRLGALAYNNKDFAKSAQFFEACEKATTVPAIRTAALNNKALAYKLGNFKVKALAAYKALAEIKTDNPFRETGLIEVATALLDSGKKEGALAAFAEVIALTKEGATLGDALIKSGLIQNELGKTDAAYKNFKHALELKELTLEKRGVAVFGMIEAAYVKGDYEGVIDTYTRNATLLPPDDLRAKMLLYVGLAQKQRKSYRQAVSVFLMIEKNHPDAPEAFEAGYQKLLCFFQLEDKDFPKFTEDFEATYRADHKNHEYLTMARLLRGDWYFTKQEYKKAAEAFNGLDMKKLPENIRADAAFHKGFAETESGNHNDAIVSLTTFINDYPKDANIPAALAQRGICRKAMSDFPKALDDFNRTVKDFPDNPAAEMAYYQIGLIKSETRDAQGVIDSFETLLNKFPKSLAAAEVNYRIGRGYFELKTKPAYVKAIEPLHKAIALDAKTWLDKASQLLISCQYLHEDLEGLSKEVDAYINAKNTASISPSVLQYLGRKYFDRGDFRSAARYLHRASTPEDAQNTEAVVWNYLGMAELENKAYQASINALDNYLAQSPEGAGHPKALYTKGRALLGLNDFAGAEACAVGGLQKMKEGKLHYQLVMLQGDIALAHGDALSAGGDEAGAMKLWKQASSSHMLVSQFFVDAEITPDALAKAIKTLEKLGEREKAATLRRQLEKEYPKYKLKE